MRSPSLGQSRLANIGRDVHHGNGIQRVFYKDANVLYVSLHVYQGGTFYPGGPEGDMQYCGDGAGVGRQVGFLFTEVHL